MSSNPNAKRITRLLATHETKLTPKEIAEQTGLSISATRRALKTSTEEGAVQKHTEGRLTYYSLAAKKLEWKRVSKGRRVFGWYVGNKRLPKNVSYAILRNLGLTHKSAMDFARRS